MLFWRVQKLDLLYVQLARYFAVCVVRLLHTRHVLVLALRRNEAMVVDFGVALTVLIN